MNKGSKLNICVTGGGTGGHVFPVKSMIEYLYNHDIYSRHIQEIYWFGSSNNLEKKVSEKLSAKGYTNHFVSIFSGKYRRETPIRAHLRNIRDFFAFLLGVIQSLFRLRHFHIDVVFCKGGYVALPVVLAARILKRKIIVHESDTHAGLVNRIAARFADKVFTGFDKVLPKSETVGQILSDDIAFGDDTNTIKNAKISEILSKIPKKKTIVLVIGGSQGSYRLYKSLISILDQDPATMSNFVFILSLGILNSDLKPEFERFSNVFAQEFFSQKEMGALCYRADIGLTRAGTTSLAEQKLYDMKLFMVPIAWTHDQYDNARYYVSRFQDLLIDQKAPEFEKHLLQAFKDHVGFRKEQKTKKRLTLVCQAKDKIAKAIVDGSA